MRQAWMGLSLVIGIATAGCHGGGEVNPPLKSVGDGVPSDLPALASGAWAVLRLTING